MKLPHWRTLCFLALLRTKKRTGTRIGHDKQALSVTYVYAIKIELINFVEQGVPKNDDLPFFS